MMNLETILIVIYFLFFHWLADFVLQTLWEQTTKSYSVRALTSHVYTYSAVTTWAFWLYTGYLTIIKHLTPIHMSMFWFFIFIVFFGVVFITHWITDFITSKITSRLYKQQKIHKFFVVVGIDQFIHVVQLSFIYYFFTNLFQ